MSNFQISIIGGLRRQMMTKQCSSCAAPDLLAALQSLIDMCRALDTGNRDMPPEAAYRAALQSASSAIEKATKEQ